ncbi:MAG TPA: N-acetylmuramoyl-L-alanine amidase [Holophagaceae bacterium]|nr:N-acetylmuramoyl-L-alanine amidase [Holophagaceae bacterium]
MRLGARLLPLLLLPGALACGARHNPLATWAPSPNHNARRAQLIVLHHTALATFEEALKVLQTRNASGPVSCHYLIGRDGRLAQLVDEDRRAWHAGSGSWGTLRDVNAASIGIELDNTGAEPFPEAQIRTLLRLLEDLTTRLHIPRTQVVGHGDTLPALKEDPSVWFPWSRLAEAGFGLWPDSVRGEPPAGFDAQVALRLIGYDLGEPGAATAAFRRHFRGLEGRELDEEDLRILFNLQRKVMAGP